VIVHTISLYLLARVEVLIARITRKLHSSGLPSPDRLPPQEIPSVALGELQDRVLGEIDQEGFIFARDPRDAPFFNRRSQKIPRRHRPLLLVLRDRIVCVEKGPQGNCKTGIRHRIQCALGWEFYLEAAALLRLQGLPFIPRLLGIDTRRRIIRLEFIWGETLYHAIAQGQVSYDEIQHSFATMLRDSASATGAEILRMLNSMADRRVTQLDVNAANFIRGRFTQTLYTIDFHLVHLRPVREPAERDSCLTAPARRPQASHGSRRTSSNLRSPGL
jgi:hypothetical protein